MIKTFAKTLAQTFVFAAIATTTIEAKDFGVMGHVFSIEEENLISLLQRNASKNLSEAAFQKILKRLDDKANHLKPVDILLEAKEARVFYYDPSYAVPENITDHRGNVIASKGTVINPLKKIQLTSGLLFFDGTNPAHVHWACKQNGTFKWILVRGNPFDLEKRETRSVYFDQNAFMTKKFKLQQIPAKVTQDKLRLKIEEIPIDDLGEVK